MYVVKSILNINTNFSTLIHNWSRFFCLHTYICTYAQIRVHYSIRRLHIHKQTNFILFCWCWDVLSKQALEVSTDN